MNLSMALALLFATGFLMAGCNPRRQSSGGDAGIAITPFAPDEGYGLEGSPCATCLHAHCEEPYARVRARRDEFRAVNDCYRRCTSDGTYAACMTTCTDAHKEFVQLQAAAGACSIANCKPLCD
jgi:hypothetical protein